MDLDWCLSCGRWINGTAPYCSPECLSHDDPLALATARYCLNPSSETFSDDDNDEHVIHHEFQLAPKAMWVGNGAEGIRQWASGIPSGAAAGAPSPNEPIFPLSNSPPLPSLRPPKLLLAHKRPVPPTLCMSTPNTSHPHPSQPISSPRQHNVTLSSCDRDVGGTSLTTALTESLVATPSSAKAAEPLFCPVKTGMIGALATQVRSWVVAPTIQPPRKQQHFPPSRPNDNAKDLATFTVIAKGRRAPAFHVLSSPSSCDSTDGMWWVSSMTVVDSQSPSLKKGFSDIARGRRVAVEQSSNSRSRRRRAIA